MTITRGAGRSPARCGVKSRLQTEQLLSTLRKARNNLPSPQRGQRQRKPRFIAVHTSRFSADAESLFHTFVTAVMLSMIGPSWICRVCFCRACEAFCGENDPDALWPWFWRLPVRVRVCVHGEQPGLPTAIRTAAHPLLVPLLPDERRQRPPAGAWLRCASRPTHGASRHS